MIVLEFRDDIRRSQFWTAFKVESLVNTKLKSKCGLPMAMSLTFRVPEDGGEEAALKRARQEFKVEDVFVQPAFPVAVMGWIESHPEECSYRVRQEGFTDRKIGLDNERG